MYVPHSCSDYSCSKDGFEEVGMKNALLNRSGFDMKMWIRKIGFLCAVWNAFIASPNHHPGVKE
jgi:hypothetical protein